MPVLSSVRAAQPTPAHDTAMRSGPSAAACATAASTCAALGDVGLRERRAPSSAASACAARLVAIDDHDLRAARDEPAHRRRAEARGTTRDERDRSGELHARNPTTDQGPRTVLRCRSLRTGSVDRGPRTVLRCRSLRTGSVNRGPRTVLRCRSLRTGSVNRGPRTVGSVNRRAGRSARAAGSSGPPSSGWRGRTGSAPCADRPRCSARPAPRWPPARSTSST